MDAQNVLTGRQLHKETDEFYVFAAGAREWLVDGNQKLTQQFIDLTEQRAKTTR